MLATPRTSTILAHAVANGGVHDDAIRRNAEEGNSGEPSLSELAIEHLHTNAEALRQQPYHRRTRFARRQMIARLHQRRATGTAHGDSGACSFGDSGRSAAGGGHERGIGVSA